MCGSERAWALHKRGKASGGEFGGEREKYITQRNAFCCRADAKGVT
jgi:hypothetical protein